MPWALIAASNGAREKEFNQRGITGEQASA